LAAQEGQNPAYRPDIASGAYLKLLIPDFCDGSDDFVLYTDCDTMFLGNCDFAALRPEFLSAAPEISGNSDQPRPDSDRFNSGIMILNVRQLASHRDAAYNLLEERHYFFRGRPGFYDQGLFNIIFEHSWDRLDFAWNWRSYWKPREGIKILHYHGPKPIQVLRFLSGGDPNALPHITKMIGDNIESYRHYEAMISALRLDTGIS
jgi:lipopolysaccharide biosynthesis glycosyltransferase